jgi:hypothetical protein
MKKIYNFDIQVYPNPSSGGFDLLSNCMEQCNITIQVSSITGQKLLEKECNLIEGNCFVDTELASGTYAVTITTTDKRTYTRKLIITN